jgi:hypothetical protein
MFRVKSLILTRINNKCIVLAMERNNEIPHNLPHEEHIPTPDTLTVGNINVAGEGSRTPTTASIAKETSKKVLFIGIALVILLLLALAIIRFVPSIISGLAGAGSSISSIFSPKEEIELKANPSSINSGGEFTLSWDTSSISEKGRLSLTYSCSDAYYIQHTYPNGRTERVICSEPFLFPTQGNSLKFTGFLTTKNDYKDVTLTVSFTPEGKEEVTLTNTATLTIRSDAGSPIGVPATTTPHTNGGTTPHATTTATSTRPTPSSHSTTTQNSGSTGNEHPWNSGITYTNPGSNSGSYTAPKVKADLVATNPLVGRVDPYTGNFIQGQIHTGDTIMVSFTVTNTGGNETGTWKLSANVPSVPEQTIISDPQRSLRSGDKMLFSLRFDNIARRSQNQVFITIDPTNTVSELNENNNTLVIPINLNISDDNYNNNSNADLTVRIIDTGTIGYSDASYIPTNYIPNGSRVGMRFEVENRGGRTTNNWIFKINLPNGQTYTSDSQSPLASGETRQITAGFDSFNSNSVNTVSIKVDSDDRINETNESNNTDSTTVRVGY